MPPPPPAEPFASRIFLGPALRAQPDRRLVKLVREGYEAAFDEIVRRYRKPLDRFAAAIVGGRSEDVTQDAFSKALLALRGTSAEIELRPWLYRIVRNTALNDLRDGPPPAEELSETIPGGRSAAAEAERREEIAELMERLRALPEPQRAALVMRELEGLSHEEIAAALGVSGGAARQAIYRARLALRDGLGLLVPLPLLRMLFDHGTEAAAAGAGGAVAAAGAASAAGGGAGATVGGLGAAGALKVGLATAVLAGSVGAGVAIQQDRDGRGPEPAEAAASRLPAGGDSDSEPIPGGSPGDSGSGQAPVVVSGADRAQGGPGPGDDKGREVDPDDHRRRGSSDTDDDLEDSHGGSGSGRGEGSGHGGRGSGHGGRSGPADDAGEGVSESHSGRHGSGSESGSGSSGSGHGGSSGESGEEDSRQSGSGDPGSGGHGGSGESGPSGGPAPSTSPPPAPESARAPEDPDDSRSESSGSGNDDLTRVEDDS